jgi:hypothetical protein
MSEVWMENWMNKLETEWICARDGYKTAIERANFYLENGYKIINLVPINNGLGWAYFIAAVKE